jgi:hypothetical protein
MVSCVSSNRWLRLSWRFGPLKPNTRRVQASCDVIGHPYSGFAAGNETAA